MSRCARACAVGIAAALLGMALPPAAQAAAGTVLFALGRVEIERAGQMLPAPRGTAVEVGDTVSTGPTGLAQLRLKDGALLALKSGTRLTVEDFHLPAPVAPAAAAPAPTMRVADDVVGPGGRSVLRLLRGALRTVTGLIGKNAGDTYSVVTPAATLGIRGTDYSAAYCSGDCGSTPDGLYVGVSDGAVYVSNDAGELVLSDNQYGYVRDRSTPPEQGMAPPEVLEVPIEVEEGDAPAGGDGETYADYETAPAAEDTKSLGGGKTAARIETGSSQPEGTYELLPGEPGTFAFSLGPFQGSAKFAGASTNGVYTDDGGALVGFLSADTQRVVFYSIGSSLNVNQGADAEIGLRWGRWSGGDANVGGAALNLSNQSLHWIYALAPSAPVLPAGGTVSYGLIGSTDPTDDFGNVGFLGSATLTANFTDQTVASTLNLGINSQVWQASGSGSLFSGTPVFAGGYSVGVNDAFGSPLATGTGSFTGFFTDGALGAGLSYSLNSAALGTTVSGAAAFASSVPPP